MYVLKASGLFLPIEGSLGEDQVIKRALNLLQEFNDLKVYKKNSDGEYKILKEFLKSKKQRQLIYHPKTLSRV